MQTHFDIACQYLLSPTGLTLHKIEQVLSEFSHSTIDFADLYFQENISEGWVLEDGLINEGVYDIDRGVGVRVISGEKTGFAYTDDITLPALLKVAHMARTIAQRGGDVTPVSLRPVQKNRHFYDRINPLDTFSTADKIALLQRIDHEARRCDARVLKVNARLSGHYEIVLIVVGNGMMAADIRPLVNLQVSVIVEERGRRESGFYGGGGRCGYEYFVENDRVSQYVREAVRQAAVNLEARPAPAGLMPVVLGPGWPGILLHESVGHGLEGDFNRKQTSAFVGRLGTRVASKLCTIVDDGTLMNRRGSLSIDDEGHPTQCTTLIEKGILKGYMQDSLNARLMRGWSTGNARRESYSTVAIPRMTNTYLLPGPHDPEEIIASVDRGIYAVSFSGGQVDITSGKFVFSMNEAYLIEKGKITHPVKEATLIGHGPDVLTKVSMVGHDLAFDSGIGTCGKDGQSIPVGVGQPTLKIDELTVGGTAQG